MINARQLTATALLAIGAIPLTAGAASAAPPSAQLDGTYVCSTGQSFDVYVSGTSLVGYVDGRGVAPRAFHFTSRLQLTVQDGPYAGDVITASVDSGVTGPSGDAVKPVALQGTSTCTQSVTQGVEFVVDQEAVNFFGIDAKYLGATVTGTESASITVFVTMELLLHR